MKYLLALALSLFAVPAHAQCADPAARIFFFGDSICSAYIGASSIPGELHALCTAPTITSQCDPGRTTETAGWSGIAPMTAFVAAMTTAPIPTVVLIELGTNNEASYSLETTIDDLRWYVDAARGAGATPVLLTVWPISDGFTPGSAFWRGLLHERTMALGAAMGVQVLDMTAPYNVKTYRTDCTFDGTYYDNVHPRVLACKQAAAAYIARELP